jgi:hypothetical protein
MTVNPFSAAVQGLRQQNNVYQVPPYPKANTKYTGDDIANLLDLIVQKQRGIDYNPNLTYPEGAQLHLNKKGLAKKGWTVMSGDFDTDPNTPDNVLLVDDKKIPRVVDGYSIGTGNRKRRDNVFLQHKGVYNSLESNELKKQFMKYLRSPEGKAADYGDFDEWNRTHPRVESNYTRLQRYLSSRLSRILEGLNIPKTAVNYIPLLSEIMKVIITEYKKLNPSVKKLTTQDYEKIANYELENKDLSGVIQKHLKTKGRLVTYSADPFATPTTTYQAYNRGTPSVNVKRQSQAPSFIPPSSTATQETTDDSTIFEE